VLLGKKSQLGLGSLLKALSQKSSRTYGDLALDNMVPAPERVAFRREKVQNPSLLVIPEIKAPPEKYRRERRQSKGQDGSETDPDKKDHGKCDKRHQDRCSQVRLFHYQYHGNRQKEERIEQVFQFHAAGRYNR